MSGNYPTEEFDNPQLRAELFLSEDRSDVTFVVQDERLPAHRALLANRCEYFRGMFYSGFSEAYKSDVKLTVNLDAFKVLLQYVYTGKFEISQHTVEVMVDILNLANEYGFDELMSRILSTITHRFSIDNFAIVMNTVQLYHQMQYFRIFLSFVDEQAAHVLKHDGFKLLSRVVLAHILSRDSFAVNEVDIFAAVMAWRTTHTEDDLKCVLPFVRFTLMQISDLYQIVQPTGVLEPAELQEFENEIKNALVLPYRAAGSHRNKLKLNRLVDTTTYGATWLNSSGEAFEGQALFELPVEYMINHIHLKLSDDTCAYYLEVSRDCRQWTRLADYTQYECYADQYLYFDLQAVRFIYIKLTHLTNPIAPYNIASVHADYKFESMPMLKKGFVAPICNISRMIAGAADGWQYDSNATLIARTCLSFDANKLTLFLYQPLYINCIFIKCEKDNNPEVLQIETALRRNEFQCLDLKRDHVGKGFFFEPHLVSFIRIQFAKRPQPSKNNSVLFFFHPGMSHMFSGGSSKERPTMDLF